MIEDNNASNGFYARDPFFPLDDLADHFRLTVYDAAYLELARRGGLPLSELMRVIQRGAGE